MKKFILYLLDVILIAMLTTAFFFFNGELNRKSNEDLEDLISTQLSNQYLNGRKIIGDITSIEDNGSEYIIHSKFGVDTKSESTISKADLNEKDVEFINKSTKSIGEIQATRESNSSLYSILIVSYILGLSIAIILMLLIYFMID